jgi:hypothetical protein
MRRMGGGVDGRWNGMCVDGGKSTARWTVTTTAVMLTFTLHSRPARLTVASCVPVCQPGLATTPKLTGGHDVARGPERIDGFALRHGRKPDGCQAEGIVVVLVLWFS